MRIAAFVQLVMRAQSLRQRTPRAFGEQRVFSAQFHAAGEIAAVLAFLVDAHVAGRNANDLVVLEQNFGGGEARIDFDAERFGFFRKPAADIAERDDIIAVVRH